MEHILVICKYGNSSNIVYIFDISLTNSSNSIMTYKVTCALYVAYHKIVLGLQTHKLGNKKQEHTSPSADIFSYPICHVWFPTINHIRSYGTK